MMSSTARFHPLEAGNFAWTVFGELIWILVPSWWGMITGMSAASSMDLSLSLSPSATVIHSVSGNFSW